MKNKYKLRMIISGGQTGVDRAALDFALANQIQCSGWCPKNRRAEDGIIPIKYPIIEMNSGFYPPRTRKNIEDSDATLIFAEETLKGGTKLTLDYANKINKPVLCVKKSEKMPSELLIKWLNKVKPKILNVAGPRLSENAELYDYTISVLTSSIVSVKNDRLILWPPKRATMRTFDELNEKI